MASIQLKVNPTDLTTKATEITDLVGKISRQYNMLKSNAEASVGYWEGDAANAFRAYVKSLDKEMQTVLKRLGEHPVDLVKMAGLYETNEGQIQERISTLPTEVIK